MPGENSRLSFCRNLIVNGKKVYFCCRLGTDNMYTDKYMPPSVNIKVKLIRNNPTFSILHGEDDKSFKIVLKDLKLKMRKVLPIEQQRNHFRMKMSQQPCYIPFKLSQLKVFRGLDAQQQAQPLQFSTIRSKLFQPCQERSMHLPESFSARFRRRQLHGLV